MRPRRLRTMRPHRPRRQPMQAPLPISLKCRIVRPLLPRRIPSNRLSPRSRPIAAGRNTAPTHSAATPRLRPPHRQRRVRPTRPTRRWQATLRRLNRLQPMPRRPLLPTQPPRMRRPARRTLCRRLFRIHLQRPRRGPRVRSLPCRLRARLQRRAACPLSRPQRRSPAVRPPCPRLLLLPPIPTPPVRSVRDSLRFRRAAPRWLR